MTKAQNLKPTLTPAPNAASLGKYGDIPVSYFTGTASPSVPIGSVDEGSLSMPVSLSYHTGGIKVTENASWCGLGWSLQAGGMITRVVQGVADDNISKFGYYHSGSTLNFAYPTNTQNTVDALKGDRDTEPDVFSVNFNGNSGKFYFDKDKICRFVEKRDWLVVPILENFEFKGFVVTTEDGTRYHFGRVQGLTNSPIVERSGDYTNQQFTTTSWYLVKVESHDSKDAINLTYIPEDYEHKQPNYCREFLVISGCATGTNLVNQCNGFPTTTVIQQGWRLSSITNSSGTQTINFIATTVRQDLPVRLYSGIRASEYGGVAGEEAKRLDQIQIVSGTYTINHILEYDYIYDGAAVTRTSAATNSRLRLLRVKKQKGTVDDQIYSFDYLNNLGAGKETFFPTPMSKQIDHWGYYNGAIANDNLNLLAPPTKVFNDAGTTFKQSGLANRESNETTMKHGSLKRINFPTGGYTDFTLEANKHTALETTMSSNLVFILNAGYGSSDCSVPLAAERCWASLTDPIANFTYKITFGNTYTLGTCSASAPSGTIQFIDETTLLTVATIPLSAPTTTPPTPLSNIFNFDPTKRYRVTINISNANLCVFELNKNVSQTVLTTRAVGGLRVQQVTNYDHVTQVSNSKTYTYVDAQGSTSSSGFLFNVPKYGHYISNVHLDGVMFWSGSVTPMSNYQGYHIGYKRVEEKVTGSIGKTVYVYKADKEFNNPGESYSSSNESYPILPRMPNFSNGQLSTSTQLNQAGTAVASSTYTGIPFGQPVIGETFYKIYYLGELIPFFADNTANCINGGNGPIDVMPALYKVSSYLGIYGNYRLQSKTEVLDNVSTTTTYKYDVSNRHLMSTGTRVINSEGKEYETSIKYVHDFVGGELATTSPANVVLITADLVTNLKSRNIIATPIETKTTVKTGTTTITTGGQRMQFSFFDAVGAPTTTIGTNPIYIYKSYAYETPHDNTTYAESKWQLKATITKYNMTYGKPELYLTDGWIVSEKYSYNATNRLVSKKEFLGTTTGLTWDYEYVPNTKLLSKYTDENRLVKTFTYDPLMRLQIIKDRMKTDGTDVQATTTYDYYYYKATSPTIPSYVSMSTMFVNATNTTPLSSKQYLDGLGRPLSTVKETYTPSLLHQKNNLTYDALGRKDKTYLPFENSSLGYETALGGTPFAFMTYDDNPLSRPKQQTNVDNSIVSTQYSTNTDIDQVRSFNNAPASAVASFSGSNSLRVVQDIPEQNFTVDFFMKTANPNTGIFCAASGTQGSDGHDRHLYLQNGILNVRVWQGNSWSTGVVLNDNQWHHIALVVKTGVGQNIYIDGSLVTPSSSYDHSDFTWQTEFWIGYSNDLGYFQGQMSNFRIWNVGQSAADINSMSYKQFNSTLGLIFSLPMNGNFTPTVGPTPINNGGVSFINTSDFYAANTLYKTIMTDENAKLTCIFKDKLGRAILTRKFLGTQNVDTYNVYNDYGQLVAVLPPGSMDQYTGTVTEHLIFWYKYDNQNRLSQKKIPGTTGSYKFYYDNRDLLTLTQDPNMQDGNYRNFADQHLATQYDALGRVERTGFVATADPVAFATTPFTIPDGPNKLTENIYYPNKSWVKHRGAKFLETHGPSNTNFIWSYEQRDNANSYTGNPGWIGKQHLITGPLVNRPINEPTDTWGVDWSSSAYYGTQQAEVTYRYLYGYSWIGNKVITRSNFAYDNGSRLTDVKFNYTVDGSFPTEATTSMSNLVYNPKDQLTERNIGYNGTTALQSVDYTYNLRGWLTAINDVTIYGQTIPIMTPPMSGSGYIQGIAAMPFVKQALTEKLKTGSFDLPPVADSDNNNGDLFSQALTYGSVDSRTGGTPQYNGNISTTTWQVKGRAKQAYAFTYDDLDRLLNAKYMDVMDSGSGSSQISSYGTENKFEEKQTYDLRGNITSLERNGLNAGTWTNGNQGYTAATYGKIDNLQFNYYEGNKLVRVAENSLPDRGFKTDKSPSDGNWQYGYDANGNLKFDFNKGIVNIWYNHLNLPSFVYFTHGRQITFNYTADGELLRKTTYNPGDNTSSWMEYVNGTEYKNWVLNRLPHPEGSVIRNDAGNYEYEYTLKDHLGSNRVVFRDKDNDRIIDTSDIKQINHTYPFGMDMEGNWNGSFAGSGTSGNSYKYNGKEFNNDYGLGWYHYGARFYDPAIGRFPSVDRFTEKYLNFSPYQYASNNPIKYIDVNGDSTGVLMYGGKGEEKTRIIYEDKLNGVPVQDGNLFIIKSSTDIDLPTFKSFSELTEYLKENNQPEALVQASSSNPDQYNSKGKMSWLLSVGQTERYIKAIMNTIGMQTGHYSLKRTNHSEVAFGFDIPLGNDGAVSKFKGPIEFRYSGHSRIQRLYGSYYALSNSLGHEKSHEGDWIDLQGIKGSPRIPNTEQTAWRRELQNVNSHPQLYPQFYREEVIKNAKKHVGQ